MGAFTVLVILAPTWMTPKRKGMVGREKGINRRKGATAYRRLTHTLVESPFGVEVSRQ